MKQTQINKPNVAALLMTFLLIMAPWAVNLFAEDSSQPSVANSTQQNQVPTQPVGGAIAVGAIAGAVVGGTVVPSGSLAPVSPISPPQDPAPPLIGPAPVPPKPSVTPPVIDPDTSHVHPPDKDGNVVVHFTDEDGKPVVTVTLPAPSGIVGGHTHVEKDGTLVIHFEIDKDGDGTTDEIIEIIVSKPTVKPVEPPTGGPRPPTSFT